MRHYYAKFKENPFVGTDASTPLNEIETYYPSPLNIEMDSSN